MATTEEASKIVNDVCDRTKKESGPWVEVSDSKPLDDDEKLVVYKSRYTDNVLYGLAWWSDGRWCSEDDSVDVYNILAWQNIAKYPVCKRKQLKVK